MDVIMLTESARKSQEVFTKARWSDFYACQKNHSHSNNSIVTVKEMTVMNYLIEYDLWTNWNTTSIYEKKPNLSQEIWKQRHAQLHSNICNVKIWQKNLKSPNWSRVIKMHRKIAGSSLYKLTLKCYFC